MTAFEIHVEWKASADQPGTPQAFFLGQRRVAVDRVLDRWPGADHCYLKLRGEDGGLYILRQDAASGCWSITLFEAQPDPGAPAHPPASRMPLVS